VNPLTIWLYTKPYLRFSAEDYSLNDLRNNQKQLTNASLNNKDGKLFEK
jgi:hypothetical protein